MKIFGKFLLGLAVLVAGSNLNGQDQSPQSAQPDRPASQAQQPHAQPMSMQERMAEMRRQQEAEMQQVKAELDRMRTMVSKMRSDAGKINDQSTKSAMTTNAEMWQSWIDSMQRRVDHMHAMLEQQAPARQDTQK